MEEFDMEIHDKVIDEMKSEKPKAKPKKAKPKWVPIARFPAYDFDEATGRFLDSMAQVELQQEKNSKKIQCVVVNR